MPGIRCRAFAKINLSLDVLGRRSDGYHEVDLIMQLLELHDLIEVEWTPDEKAEAERRDFRDGITSVREALAGWVEITGDHPGLACDESNLAWKAYERMARVYEESHGYRPLGKLQIHIRKRIPLAAGLAGGSADCAAVLHACNHLWEMGLDLETLCLLGAELGADVPFALRGQALGNPELGMEDAPGAMYAARGRGIGEELEALPSVEGEVLLLTPPREVSTAEVYRGVDREDSRLPLALELGLGSVAPGIVKEERGLLLIRRPDMEAVSRAIKKQDFFSAREKIGNVLEFYTLKRYHDVAYTKYMMQQSCPETPVLMSGSGPTVFCISQEEGVLQGAEADLASLPGQLLRTRSMRRPRC